MSVRYHNKVRKEVQDIMRDPQKAINVIKAVFGIDQPHTPGGNIHELKEIIIPTEGEKKIKLTRVG